MTFFDGHNAKGLGVYCPACDYPNRPRDRGRGERVIKSDNRPRHIGHRGTPKRTIGQCTIKIVGETGIIGKRRIHGDDVCCGRGHTPAQPLPHPIRIMDGDNLTRADNNPIQARAKTDRFRFVGFTIQQPLPNTVGLATAGASGGYNVGFDHTVSGNPCHVFDVFDFLPVKIVGIIPCHQGHGVTGFQAAACIGKRAIHHIAVGVQGHRIAGGILHGHNLPTRPVCHATKDRRHILQDLIGLCSGL